jgi:hypothetical protein
MGPKKDSRDDDIACPAGAPLPVPKDPFMQGVDERLQRALNLRRPEGGRRPLRSGWT